MNCLANRDGKPNKNDNVNSGVRSKQILLCIRSPTGPVGWAGAMKHSRSSVAASVCVCAYSNPCLALATDFIGWLSLRDITFTGLLTQTHPRPAQWHPRSPPPPPGTLCRPCAAPADRSRGGSPRALPRASRCRAPSRSPGGGP